MMFTFDAIPGVVSDETLFSSPGRWSDASNTRFRNGRVESVGGWVTYNATAIGDVCRNVLAWTDNYNGTNVAFGTVTTLEVEVNGTIYDITPSGLVAGLEDSGMTGPGGYGSGGYGMGGYGVGEYDQLARTWSLATWGENLVASPRLGGVYIWANDTSAVATLISQAPDTVVSLLVPPDSRQIRCFGCADTGGAFDTSVVRGCDPSDYTDWTPSTSNNAFQVYIEGGDPIVSARTFADRDAIWTDAGVYMGTFVGGAQKYRIDKQAASCGLAGSNAACVSNKVAYWLTPDLRFFAWAYGGVPQEIPCPISRDFRDNITTAQIQKVVCSPISKYGEVWWLYPDGRDGAGTENSRYVSYHVDESLRAGTAVWSRGNVARTAALDSGTLGHPLMIDSSGGSFLHENGDDADGGTLTWYATTSAQYLDKAENRVLVRGVRPDIKGQTGSVSLTVYSYDYPQDATTVTYGPYALAVNDNKYDFMAEGRLLTLKYGGSAAGTYARIGSPTFDVVPTGKF